MTTELLPTDGSDNVMLRHFDALLQAQTLRVLPALDIQIAEGLSTTPGYLAVATDHWCRIMAYLDSINHLQILGAYLRDSGFDMYADGLGPVEPSTEPATTPILDSLKDETNV